ncbi:MAG: hypothetical protein ACHQHN_17115 [Sphingobacteriales bacterium]
MNENFFDIFSKRQSVSIQAESVFGSHDELHAYLHVPVNFTFRTAENTGFDMLPVNAQLFFQQPLQLLSETIGPWGTSVYSRESGASFILKFRIDQRGMHFMEKSRAGDIGMFAELNIHVLLHRSSGGPAGIQSQGVKVDFSLPRSVWVEKLLPQFGYRNLKLIEIPLSHDVLKEAYDDIVSEFNKAEHYFTLQDYNKCVAHCRNTMDTLTRHLKLIKDITKSQTAFKWIQAVGKDTLTWIDQLNKATQSITSKAHHAGQKTDFKRYEAESIYLIVLGLLNHVGHSAEDKIV